MTPAREYGDYIDDILHELRNIRSFVKGLDEKAFSKDLKTMYAVIRCFEVIGEASRKIPADLRKKYPDIPWTYMAGMRNKLIHEYFGVDPSILWTTVQERVPELLPLIRKMSQNLAD